MGVPQFMRIFWLLSYSNLKKIQYVICSTLYINIFEFSIIYLPRDRDYPTCPYTEKSITKNVQVSILLPIALHFTCVCVRRTEFNLRKQENIHFCFSIIFMVIVFIHRMLLLLLLSFIPSQFLFSCSSFLISNVNILCVYVCTQYTIHMYMRNHFDFDSLIIKRNVIVIIIQQQS